MPPFLGAVVGFTVMLLSGTLFDLMDYIFTNRMPVPVVLELLVHSIPSITVITLPIAALFATLLGLGRLVRDSEMGAIRSAGVSFRRASVPVIVASILVSGLAYVLNEHIAPSSLHRAQNLVREALFSDAMPTIEENVFFRGTGDRYFYVGRIDTKNSEMRTILIYEMDGSVYPGIISAESGTFGEGVWHLRNGVRRTFDKRGHTVDEVAFDELIYHMPPDEVPNFGNQKTTGEMTREELGEYVELFKRSGLDVKRLEVEYHLKLALPFASFIWVFLGAPLCLHSHRSARVFGVVASILIAFAYFVVTALFRSLGNNGVISPLAAAWLANIVFFVAGLWLNLRADKV